MKYHALFYQKNNENIFKMSSAAVVIGALRVNYKYHIYFTRKLFILFQAVNSIHI